MAEVIINVESLTLNREFWRPAEWVEAEGIVSHPGFVVRCRDCRYLARETEGICYHPRAQGYNNDLWCEPDGFCKWGEKKENTNEEGNQH